MQLPLSICSHCSRSMSDPHSVKGCRSRVCSESKGGNPFFDSYVEEETEQLGVVEDDAFGSTACGHLLNH